MLMLVTASAAVVSGVTGAVLVATGRSPVPGGWGAIIPPGKQVAFSADAWAHVASYGVGAAGGLVVIGCAVWRRTSRNVARAARSR